MAALLGVGSPSLGLSWATPHQDVKLSMVLWQCACLPCTISNLLEQKSTGAWGGWGGDFWEPWVWQDGGLGA